MRGIFPKRRSSPRLGIINRLGFLQQLGVLPYDFIQSLDSSVQKDRVIFIDKFLVPENAKKEFIDRMNINRNFIQELPGFVRDNVYEQIGEDGKQVITTVACLGK